MHRGFPCTGFPRGQGTEHVESTAGLWLACGWAVQLVGDTLLTEKSKACARAGAMRGASWGQLGVREPVPRGLAAPLGGTPSVGFGGKGGTNRAGAENELRVPSVGGRGPNKIKLLEQE